MLICFAKEYFENTEGSEILRLQIAMVRWIRHRQVIAFGGRRGIDSTANQPV